MGRGHFHLGAAFVLLLLALCLGSVTPGTPPPRGQIPDLRIRGSANPGSVGPGVFRPAPVVDPVPAVDLGPCPSPGATCEVVRRGVDLDGLATWWHRDGTIVKLAVERVRGVNGGELLVPVVVTRQG